ncbi:GDP-mannose-dependent alpha-(1-6)-phosphatidylinositol monomannoside mannosyltransferase [Ruegeria denitrificans]|uniref:GDP-mannose-dependent alpha-(1-6)-phosphatidylinositol monomannoside mannosyltransferase n=1 Tax=Ruegeria denitrificans TaxID=1715692 RepID=A0A0P1IKR9_9RHOB|nr:glycosyltransferase family 4 protein [Ruegeria denitrificans]CUK08752.1 GDP-mannose-dependent alpha-(1-6)-phosphatidylinositol monomannoside mannosyltransferase [Ruegeria denitrificans]
MQDIEVLAPNLKHSLSGVTTTVIRLLPIQAKMINIRATGPGLSENIPHIRLWKTLFLPNRKPIVWHARRNTEMLMGLFLRSVFRRHYKLLFTSAAQRDHSEFTKKLISKMDALIATTPQAASFLEHPSKVIMHGVDTQIFHPAEDKEALRAKLGLPTGTLIGCFGRIRPQKGVDLLVDAAIKVLPSFPDAKVVFTGNATKEFEAFQREQETKLEQAGLADRVRFLGERPWEEIVETYRALDLFVAPARHEGFGLTPLEAMASGVPAIACHGVGAFSAQIQDGVTGRLAERDNVDALAEALQCMLSDPEKMAAAGTAARQHIEQNFRIEGEAEEIVKVYRSLLAQD